MSLAIVAVAILFGLWWLTRTRELFLISIRNGKALLVRGRVPPGLLGEMKVVLAKPPVARGSVKAVKTERGGRLIFSGIDEGRQQRLRNMFALTTAAQLRNAPIIERPTLGQVMGVAWLAWLFDRR